MPEYTCTLSDELIKKAERELNEKPEWRKRDIEALRLMISKNDALHGNNEDGFLLRFLRGRKFDYDRAYALYLSYYIARVEHPEVFESFTPSSIRHVLDQSIIGVLPDRLEDGCRVLLFRPGLWDTTTFPNSDLLKANLIVVEHLLKEEATQICGLVILVDLTNFGWRHANQFGLNFARRVASFLQDTTPARVRSIHFIHEPSIFGYVFAILRPFLKEKIQKRLHFHGSSVESMHRYLPPSILPREDEFKGTGPTLPTTEFIEELMKSEGCFIEDTNAFYIDKNYTQNCISENRPEPCILRVTLTNTDSDS